MYCKAKKNFGAIRKILKIFIFENLLHKKCLKGGISIYADFGPPRYILWWCDGICHEVLTFFQIGSGHTVPSIFGRNALIWSYLLNIYACRFLGHWVQWMIDVEFWIYTLWIQQMLNDTENRTAQKDAPNFLMHFLAGP